MHHKLIAILVVVVIAAVAWFALSGNGAPASSSVISTQTSGSGPAGSQDLINSLLALRAVSLKGTIFSDPAFQALRDFTTPVQAEGVGRDDPFAPLGGSNAPSQISTQGAQIFTPKSAH